MHFIDLFDIIKKLKSPTNFMDQIHRAEFTSSALLEEYKRVRALLMRFVHENIMKSIHQSIVIETVFDKVEAILSQIPKKYSRYDVPKDKESMLIAKIIKLCLNEGIRNMQPTLKSIQYPTLFQASRRRSIKSCQAPQLQQDRY